jgi:hypothetical protein
MGKDGNLSMTWQKNATKEMWYAASKHIICCMGNKYQRNSSKEKIVKTPTGS